MIVDGDDCGKVEAKFTITHAELIAWNSAVFEDCQTNFWLGQAYCVGLGPVVSSTPTGGTPPTTQQPPTTTTPYLTRYPVTNETVVDPTYSTDWPPTKTQAGQPAYCNNWHLVQAGESCAGVIGKYHMWMSTDDL